MTHYDYSLWQETTGHGTRHFWIVDEVSDNGDEKIVASGIEKTLKAAIKKIKQYCPEIEEE